MPVKTSETRPRGTAADRGKDLVSTLSITGRQYGFQVREGCDFERVSGRGKRRRRAGVGDELGFTPGCSEPAVPGHGQVAYLAFQQALVLERWILRASVTDMGLFRVTGRWRQLEDNDP